MAQQKAPRISHREHDHPHTKHANDVCRRQVRAGGDPLVGTPAKGKPGRKRVDATVTVPQKASTKVVRNKKAKSSVAAVDELLDRTEKRMRSGPDTKQFTRDAVARWAELFDNLDGAREYLLSSDAVLVSATLVTDIAGVTLIATYDGVEWSVEVP